MGVKEICNKDCFNCKFADCILDSRYASGDPILKEMREKRKAEQKERKKLYMKAYNKKRKAVHDEQMRRWRAEHPDYNKNYYWSHKKVVSV